MWSLVTREVFGPSIRTRSLITTTKTFQNETNKKSEPSITSDEARGLFRVLDIGKPNLDDNGTRRRTWRAREPARTVDREKQMKVDQDWQAVWPTMRTFHPSVVPLPVRQGFMHLKSQVHPGKKANVELMKIPNFLHLTPPAIKSQCQVLKSFCTPWPKGDVRANFPLTETTSTYLNSSTSLRDNRARIVTWSFDVNDLNLSSQHQEKFIRLVGNRYDPVSNIVTLVTDSCPYQKQNRDYAEYLLTAIFHECQKKEEWEEKKTEKDMVKFTWSLREPRSGQEEHLNSVQNLLNEGENNESLSHYKAAVKKLYDVAGS